MVASSDFEELQNKIKDSNGSIEQENDIVSIVAKMLGIPGLEGDNVDPLLVRKKLKEAGSKEDETPSNADIAKNVSDSNKISTARVLREKYESLFATITDKDGVERLVQPDYFTENCLVRGAKSKVAGDPASMCRNTEYVSLGKCVANFVAAPLIATGEYSEVQMFFYPLNSAAGGARKYTTASLPIKKDELFIRLFFIIF